MTKNSALPAAIPAVLLAVFIISCAGSPAEQTTGSSKKTEAKAEKTEQPAAETEHHKIVIQPLEGGKFVGNIWPNSKDIYPEFTEMWGQVTPENAGKWGMAEPTRDEMRWKDLDKAYKIAKDHNLPFRLHTLVWGNQQPAWVADLSPAEQLGEVEEWMQLLSERYPDIDMIDVVNEPLHVTPSYMEALGGSGTSGWDWVIKSFELARKYFPDSMLCLNEYGIVSGGKDLPRYIRIIKLLQSRGLIDGVGLQCHFLEHIGAGTVKHNLDILAELGLPLYVTEFDVYFSDDALQAAQMRDLFSVFYEHKAVKGITLWGYQFGWMWREKAYLTNKDGSPRPAFYWMEAYLKGEHYKIPRTKTGALMGTPERIIIEAEDFTKANGASKTDSVLTGLAAGSTAMYEKVALRLDYKNITVRYAKASGSEAKLIVRINSADSDVVAEIPLKATGGSDSFAEASAEFTAKAEGFFDVYIECEGKAADVSIDSVTMGIMLNK